MLLNTDFVLPAELTGYARMAAANFPANHFRLAGWLPRRPIDDLEYRFTQGGDALIEAAPFRAYDAESSIASRPGVVRKSGSLPPISRKLLLTEYDRLRQRANPELTMRQAIFSDAERVTRQIATRLEVARGDALLNGSVTISENGVTAVVDYGRPGGCSVTASTLWSTVASADPINDLVGWVQAYIDLNGEPPAVLLTSTRVRGLMQQSAAIRALAAIGGVTPTVVSPATLNTILDSFNLPQLVTYDVRYSVVSGGVSTATRVIPDKYGLLLPPEVAPDDWEGTQLGATFTGTTAESLDPSYGIEDGSEPGIVAGVYREEDPISLWTKAAEIALPVVANPALVWKLTLAS
jgi:Phage major capsid protein E